MTIVLGHAAATLVLVGLIWTIQVVHYPLFDLVGRDGFVAYEAAHSTRIAAVIAVPWAVQGLTTAALLVSSPDGLPRWMVWAAAVLAAVPVAVTVAVSVPAHTVLSAGYDPAAHTRLVATNWLRTAAWTAHGGLAVAMLAVLLRRG